MSITSVVVAAKTKQTATVLWCHGLGDSGAGWSFLAEQLSPLFPHIKWILPNAYDCFLIEFKTFILKFIKQLDLSDLLN